MTIDDLLRETAPDPRPARARTDHLRADVLASATASARPRGRMPLRATLAAGVVGAVGLGGVAYATGSVPDIVTSAVEGFGRDANVAPADQPSLRQIVDLELPDGSRFAAWAGATEAMWCTAYADNWDGTTTGSGGTACGDAAADLDLNRHHVVWARDRTGSTHYPVLFGQAHDREVSVRVTGTLTSTGEPVDLAVPIDPGTGSYAAVLPGTSDHPWASLEEPTATLRESGLSLAFLDADGAVTRTVDDLLG